MNRAQWKNLPIFFYPEHRINKNWISSAKCNSNTCDWIVSCLLQSCSTICDSHIHVLVFGFTYLNLFESIRHSYIDLFLFQSKSHCSNFKIFSCIQHVVEVFKSNKSLEKICENIILTNRYYCRPSICYFTTSPRRMWREKLQYCSLSGQFDIACLSFGWEIIKQHKWNNYCFIICTCTCISPDYVNLHWKEQNCRYRTDVNG